MPRHRLPGLVLAAALGLLAAPTLLALGPTAMLFYGEPLKTPVLVTGADAAQFGEWLLRPATATVGDPGRPFIKVALFYGQASDPAGNGVPAGKLTPDMAWQHARFYPATAKSPALLLTAGFFKMAPRTGGAPVPTSDSGFTNGGPVPAAAIAALERLGVPIGPPK